MKEGREKRILHVNMLVYCIGDCGRRFFYYKGRYARIEVDNRGKVWWHDAYSKKRIYTHKTGFAPYGPGRGFTNGGTLKSLVEDFRDYVSKGKLLRPTVFGPWPQSFCNGDLWGYGEDMAKVRNTAIELGMLAKSQKKPEGGEKLEGNK